MAEKLPEQYSMDNFSPDTISDMEEINYKTIELMEQYENLLKKMVKQVENKWVLR